MKNATTINRRSALLGILATTVLGFVFLGPVPSADAQTLNELRERFKERYPALVRAKRAGTIGETWEGTVAVVRGVEASRAVRDLIRDENRDRQVLYRIIAEREETTPEVVARRNAERNFERAEEGEHLRDREGRWFQKEPDDEGEDDG